MKGKSIFELFVEYLKGCLLSDRTIEKYSKNVPNCSKVKDIISTITGTTEDMYHVLDLRMLDRIIDEVASSDFDVTGQRMYSCGLKRYRYFLEDYLK